MKKTRKPKPRNPMAHDLWKPKYGLRVIKRKDKTLHRKRKHKDEV
jgi:hypothetical protein